MCLIKRVENQSSKQSENCELQDIQKHSEIKEQETLGMKQQSLSHSL